jgi:hypothetical protein
MSPPAEQPPAVPTEIQHPYIVEQRRSRAATFFDLLFKFVAAACLLGILVVFVLIYKEIKYVTRGYFALSVGIGEPLEVSVKDFSLEDGLLVYLNELPSIQVNQEPWW